MKKLVDPKNPKQTRELSQDDLKKVTGGGIGRIPVREGGTTVGAGG